MNSTAAAAPQGQQPAQNNNQDQAQGQTGPINQDPMQDADTYNQTHDALDPKKYGDNTPTKLSNTSGVWKEIKRLKEDGHGDKTHVCLVMLARGPDDPPNAPPRYCNCMLKLHK